VAGRIGSGIFNWNLYSISKNAIVVNISAKSGGGLGGNIDLSDNHKYQNNYLKGKVAATGGFGHYFYAGTITNNLVVVDSAKSTRSGASVLYGSVSNIFLQ
jgi:hypothetical protein